MKISNGKLFVSVVTAALFVFLLTGSPAPVVAEDILNCAECHENHTVHPYPEEEADEIVPCEACHGEPDPALSVEENHQTIFKPGMEEINSGELCFNCHTK